MMDFKLGDRVSLKPHVAESLLDDACASVERKSSNSYRAKVIPANPEACWHNHCRVLRIFQDGGLLLENASGYVRQADRDTIIKRYD